MAAEFFPLYLPIIVTLPAQGSRNCVDIAELASTRHLISAFNRCGTEHH